MITRKKLIILLFVLTIVIMASSFVYKDQIVTSMGKLGVPLQNGIVGSTSTQTSAPTPTSTSAPKQTPTPPPKPTPTSTPAPSPAPSQVQFTADQNDAPNMVCLYFIR